MIAPLLLLAGSAAASPALISRAGSAETFKLSSQHVGEIIFLAEGVTIDSKKVPLMLGDPWLRPADLNNSLIMTSTDVFKVDGPSILTEYSTEDDPAVYTLATVQFGKAAPQTGGLEVYNISAWTGLAPQGTLRLGGAGWQNITAEWPERVVGLQFADRNVNIDELPVYEGLLSNSTGDWDMGAVKSDAGEITFGGTNPSAYDGEIQYKKIENSSVSMKVDGKVIPVGDASDGDIRIGHIMTVLNPTAAAAVHKEIPGAEQIPATDGDELQGWAIPCNTTSNITVNWGGQDLKLPFNFLVGFKTETEGMCLSTIVTDAPTDSDEEVDDQYGPILGYGFFKDVYVAFKWNYETTHSSWYAEKVESPGSISVGFAPLKSKQSNDKEDSNNGTSSSEKDGDKNAASSRHSSIVGAVVASALLWALF